MQEKLDFLECRNNKTTQLNILNKAFNCLIATNIGGSILIEDKIKIICESENICALTFFDDRVYDAIGTLYIKKKEFGVSEVKISAKDILEVGFGVAKPSKKQIEKIYESIMKLVSLRIKLNVSDQLKYKKNSKMLEMLDSLDLKTGSVHNKGMLHADTNYDPDEDENRIYNFNITIYAEPVLYQFSRIFNQFRNIPTKYLNTSIHMSENTIALETYILKRLSLYKKLGNKILFDSLMKDCGFDQLEHKNQKQRIKKYLIDELDFLKSKGAIKEYTINLKKNKAIDSIEFILNKED